MRLLTSNTKHVPTFREYHENYVLLESKDVSLSSGVSYHHPCVLDTSGIMYLCSWLVMEPTEGVYNFAPLITTLNYAHAFNKKLIVRINYKSYSAIQPKPLPSYILNDDVTYGGSAGTGGTWMNSFLGYSPRFDNKNVRARWYALIEAMSSAIYGHPALDGIGPDESAWGFADTWEDQVAAGLTTLAIKQSHRERCSHLKQHFPNIDIYPFYNYCDGSPDAEVIEELDWSVRQGMSIGISDTFPRPERSSSAQPVDSYFPSPTKTVMCVDWLSTKEDDSGLYDRMIRCAMETARCGANITAWYNRGGASSNYWAAMKNAMAVVG